MITMRCAILDSQANETGVVAETLARAGHVCHVFVCAKTLMLQLQHQSFDMLIICLNCDDPSCADFVRAVRDCAGFGLPVMVVDSTSDEGAVERILDAGADDHVCKPATRGMLLSRVGALLRRAYRIDPRAVFEVFDGFRFDLISRRIFIEGREIDVTYLEFEVALLLFRHLGRSVSRMHMLEVIWKRNGPVRSRTVDAHVSLVRLKLGLRPDNGYRISAVYGYGYQLVKVTSLLTR